MIMDLQLPHAHRHVGKVVKLNASVDGFIRSAEVRGQDLPPTSSTSGPVTGIHRQ